MQLELWFWANLKAYQIHGSDMPVWEYGLISILYQF
jgi:hypothetical protein